MSKTILTISIPILLLLHTCCGNTKSVSKTSVASKKPNIIILLADDLGWNDVGYHGSDIQTPNIDKLAKEGIELNRFYVNHSCSPSRAALMTGRYPGRLGILRVIYPQQKGGLSPEEDLLPELLAKEGYQHRACIGKWHLGHSHVKYHPLNQGFSYFYGHYTGQINYFTHERYGELDWHQNFEPCYDQGYATDLIGNEAVNYIETVPKDEPFFLYIPFNAPHTPLQAPERYLNMYNYDPCSPTFAAKNGECHTPRRPNEWGQGNTKRQTYAAMVTAMDVAIGRVIQTVEKKGIRDNTIILFLSDNGGNPKEGASNKPLSKGKSTYHEGGVRVPAIISYPNMFKEKRKEISIMAHVDIFPTILSLINSKSFPTKAFDGLDMSSILKRKQKVMDRIFYLGPKALVTNTHKLAYNKLFNLSDNIKETKDFAKIDTILFTQLTDTLNKLKENIEVSIETDDSFKAHKEWKMPND